MIIFVTLLLSVFQAFGGNPTQESNYILEFNQIASSVYSDLLDCAHGEADKAKKMYFDAEFKCPSGRELHEQIRDFHSQVRNFIQTAEFTKINLLTSEMMSSKQLSYHPFFVQVMIEIMVTAVRFSGTSAVYEQILFGGSSMEHPYSIDFGQRIKELTAGYIPAMNIRSKYSQASLYVNTLNLAKLFFSRSQSQQCINLGMWPEANYAVVDAIARQANAIVGGSTHVHQLIGLVDSLCPIDTYGMGLRHESLIKEYRQLAEKYGIGVTIKSECNYYLNLVRSSGRLVRCISVDPGSPEDPVWVN